MSNKPANISEEGPEELQPTVILASIMIKVKVAPIMDEEDRETIQEKVAELLNDDNMGDIINAYIEDAENVKALGWESGDVELLTENVVWEVSD